MFVVNKTDNKCCVIVVIVAVARAGGRSRTAGNGNGAESGTNYAGMESGAIVLSCEGYEQIGAA